MRRVMKPRKARPRGDGQAGSSVSQGESHAAGGQVGRGVGAQTDEGRLAERGQAADAGQQHQADGDDGVQADVVEQRDVEFGQHSGPPPAGR
jgi:hypothetical protein